MKRNMKGFVMDEEPSMQLVLEEERKKKCKRKARLRVSKPSDVVAGMPLGMWKLLVFPILSLRDLVFVRRLCRLLAGYKPLKKLVTLKERAAFGKTNRRFWNKVSECNRANIELMRPDQFYYWKQKDPECVGVFQKNAKAEFGIFASRSELLVQLARNLKDVRPAVFSMHRGQKHVSGGIRVSFGQDGHMHAYYFGKACIGYHGLTKEFMTSIMYRYPEAIFDKLYVQHRDALYVTTIYSFEEFYQQEKEAQ